MTRPMLPPSRRAVIASAATAAALTLTGCGGATIAGLKDAPTEPEGGAAVSQDIATSAVRRALAAAASAQGDSSPDGAERRKATFSGPALVQAELYASTGMAGLPTARPVTGVASAEVVAISSGRDWPRAIVATTTDERTEVVQVHALVADDARSPFRVFASVGLAPGASIPSLGTLDVGADLVSPGEGDPAATAVLDAYAASMAWPAPQKASPLVSVHDPFSAEQRRNIEETANDLRNRARVSQTQKADHENVLAMRLADGGTLVFAGMSRTDVFDVGTRTRHLTVPEDLRELSGRSTAPQRLTTERAETVAMVIPAAGRAKLVGAREQTAKVTAR